MPVHNPPITLATAQNLVSKDVTENGAEIRRLMQQAKQAGADLIHFGEGALSGYVKAQIHDWRDVDWQTLRDELELITTLAGELGIWVVLGSNHQLSKPNRPHNSLYIISSEGKLHTRYDKQWLSHTEVSDWYTPGNSLCIFEVNGWRFGCAICIEIQFPELFIAYAHAGVDAVLYSAYADSTMFRIQAQGYAASHNVWFSFATVAQMTGTRPSHMLGPDGEVGAQCEHNSPSFCLNTLDTQAEKWKVPIQFAKPWRLRAREGSIYSDKQVDDPRSTEKTQF